MKEVGTLQELGVKVGDVVEYVSGSPCHEYRIGNRYTCENTSEGVVIIRNCFGFNKMHSRWLYRIVSRATPSTKLWRDMTPEEKGALLLAAHEGKVIENKSPSSDWTVGTPFWAESYAYRIKPEPKVDVVKLMTGAVYNWVSEPESKCGDRNTHRITFNLIDGKPDCASVKMECI